MLIEPCYRPIPESNREPREAVLVTVESVPREIISEVVVNQAARDLLPNALKYLTAVDWLANNAAMSIPAVSEAGRTIISPASFGRAIPLGFGQIPFGNTLGRVVSGKGAWMCGKIPAEVERGADFNFNHLGLLSVDGAQGDTELSNQLIAAGFRSALHLGHLVFNQVKLHRWLLDKWAKSENQSRWSLIMEISFMQVTSDGGPSYLFRVGGSTERLAEPFVFYTQLLRSHVRRSKTEMAQVARMFLCESQLPHFQIANLLNNQNDSDKLQILTALNKIGQRQRITPTEFVAFSRLVAGIYLQNIKSLITLNQALPRPLDVFEVSRAKDVDLAHFSCDFDAALENLREFTAPEINCYIREALKTMKSYFDSLWLAFVNPNPKLDETVITNMMDRIHLDLSTALRLL